MHSRTLYQTESSELLRLNYHHSNATFLDRSALLLLSYVRVTQLLQGPHHCRHDRCLPGLWSGTTLHWTFVCSSALHARHNWQPKMYGTIQMRWLIFLSSTTTNEGEELWATTTTTTNKAKMSSDICVLLSYFSWWGKTVYVRLKTGG